MEALFSTCLTFREALIKKVGNLDDDALDFIPEGFNNSIRWNLAHLVATPCLLTYRMTGQEPPLISGDFIDSAKKGTNPNDFSLIEDFGIKHLCELLIEVPKQIQRDYPDLKDLEFKPYETSTGFMMKNIDQAIAYSNIHDGIHFGTVSAIKTLFDQS
jgi:hypothetical protein